jgi:hypothetical protein
MRAEYLASVFTLHSFDFEDEEILVPHHLAKEVRDAIRTAGQRLDAVNEKVERTLAELKRNRKGRATRANAA